MKKWFLKQIGRLVDFLLPKSTKVKVPDEVTQVVNRAVRWVDDAHADFTHAAKFEDVKKIKINTKNLENPLAGIQHEATTHNPVDALTLDAIRARAKSTAARRLHRPPHFALQANSTLRPHTPINSQQTPLVRALERRKSIQEIARDMEAIVARINMKTPIYQKSGVRI